MSEGREEAALTELPASIAVRRIALDLTETMAAACATLARGAEHTAIAPSEASDDERERPTNTDSSHAQSSNTADDNTNTSNTNNEAETTDDSAEALHDFRVSVRRLRSWLRAFEDLAPVPRRVRRRLRRLAALTNEGRDAEVTIELLQRAAEAEAAWARGAQWMIANLRARREQLDSSELEGMVDDVAFVAGRLHERFAIVRFRHRVQEPFVPETLREVIAPRLEAAACDLRSLLTSLVATGDDESGHEARIAAKRLRYLIEPISGTLPGARRCIRRLKELQDDLGAWHDLQVAAALLHEAVDEVTRLEAAERAHELMAAAAEARKPRRARPSMVRDLAAISGQWRLWEAEAATAVRLHWDPTGSAALFEPLDALVAQAADPRR